MHHPFDLLDVLSNMFLIMQNNILYNHFIFWCKHNIYFSSIYLESSLNVNGGLRFILFLSHAQLISDHNEIYITEYLGY